jgi:hypothetical protein
MRASSKNALIINGLKIFDESACAKAVQAVTAFAPL